MAPNSPLLLTVPGGEEKLAETGQGDQHVLPNSFRDHFLFSNCYRFDSLSKKTREGSARHDIC